MYLFESHDVMLVFAAATLGHHALEMFLKAALILEGATVFDPAKVSRLDLSVRLDAADCVWGHNLGVLARKLAARRPDFDLKQPMIFLMPVARSDPSNVRQSDHRTRIRIVRPILLGAALSAGVEDDGRCG